MKKILYFIIIGLISSTFFLSGCGGSGGSGASKTPDVSVSPKTPSNSEEGAQHPGDNNTNIDYVIIVHPDENGKLNINNEAIDSADYNSENVTVTDEHGNAVDFAVTDNGEIKISPQDGSAEGEYTVVIITDEREYTLVIKVDENNEAEVVTSISNPVGSSMVVDLDEGILNINDNSYVILSLNEDGKYSRDSSVKSITVDAGAAELIGTVDPVTGDIIVSGNYDGPFNVTIVMEDGTVITFITDSSGKISGNITVSGSAVMVNLDNGKLGTDSGSVTLTEKSSGKWFWVNNVEVLSATAGDGTITVDLSDIKVNGSTGDIMITGKDSVPSGPYEIKVSVNGELYIIKTDASGNITGIIPGNILLQLQDGYAIHSGNDIIKVSEKINGVWGLNSSISSFTAENENGTGIYIDIDKESGNIITTSEAAGQVTITFDYTDDKENVITYTLVVQNGSLVSYSALISEPGPDFDFSTVTNIRISLKVSDKKTGLSLGQASISLMKADNSLNWQGFTDNAGISIFTATVDSASKTARVVVTRDGYEAVNCNIDGIGRLVEFGKNIAMKPVENAVVIDSDGDGVPDEDDEFPNDPNAARRLTGVYTIAFEDLYPSKGDADFNDVVIRLTLEEKIDSQNRVREITIKTKLLASGAGNDNKIGINVYGHRLILIDSPRTFLGKEKTGWLSYRDRYNARPDEAYFDVPEVSTTITLNKARTEAMPYDPFIICNGVEGKEVHLPFVKTSYKGKVLDEDGFPWALLVPSDWSWPYESGSIYNAYPYFKEWYESDGVFYENWYLNSEPGYIYQK